MDHYDLSERFARMWRQSRADAGKSQDYLAKKLGVSKKTIQNWEAGLASPSQMKGFEWFEALGRQPLPYYLQLLFPEEYEDLSPSSDNQAIEDALITYIKSCRPATKRKLLFMLNGSHGSSPEGLLEMITAYLHTPLKNRLCVASATILNYEIAEAHGELIDQEHIAPDVDLLRRSLERSKEAVLDGMNAYTNVTKECEQ